MTSFDQVAIRRFTPPETLSEPVLLIHGFATTGLQQWHMTGWIKRLVAAGIPAITVDLPFHGVAHLKETAPKGLREVEVQDVVPVVGRDLFASTAAALAGYIEELDQPLHLVGFSAGARIAYEIATEDSEYIRSLTVGGLPQHSDLTELNSFLNPASSSLTSENSLNPAFEEIIENSAVKRESLARFVSYPTSFEFEPSHHLPVAPTLVVRGSADTIAGDSTWLTQALSEHGIDHKTLEFPGRDHVNALTSGVFKKETIAWIQEHQQV